MVFRVYNMLVYSVHVSVSGFEFFIQINAQTP